MGLTRARYVAAPARLCRSSPTLGGTCHAGAACRPSPLAKPGRTGCPVTCDRPGDRLRPPCRRHRGTPSRAYVVASDVVRAPPEQPATSSGRAPNADRSRRRMIDLSRPSAVVDAEVLTSLCGTTIRQSADGRWFADQILDGDLGPWAYVALPRPWPRTAVRQRLGEDP